MEELGVKARVAIEIEKRLPVQGGLGAASSNAVATMIALERALKRSMSGEARYRIAAEIGSDLPLFLVGGAVLGVGRGEEVYPLPDLPAIPIVVITPDVGVSTPRAFKDWDAMTAEAAPASADPAGQPRTALPAPFPELTAPGPSDRLLMVGRALSAWLSGSPKTGAPAKGGSRAGSLLLDLVRTGIENDFEKVVFPKYPELRDMKRALERAGCRYASLSGSGSTLYGLFRSRAEAAKAAGRLQKQGLRAIATSVWTRQQYRRRVLVSSC